MNLAPARRAFGLILFSAVLVSPATAQRAVISAGPGTPQDLSAIDDVTSSGISITSRIVGSGAPVVGYGDVGYGHFNLGVESQPLQVLHSTLGVVATSESGVLFPSWGKIGQHPNPRRGPVRYSGDSRACSAGRSGIQSGAVVGRLRDRGGGKGATGRH